MNRRNFIQSLIAGAAVVMLPALAKDPVVVINTPAAWVPTTVAELTQWMEERFNCRDMEPMSFVEHKAEDVPKLYGFSASDIPDVGQFDIVRFIPIVMAYGCAGDDPVVSEARLVQMLHTKFLELEAQTPILWRVKPAFDTYHATEYGDVWMTREQVEDRADLQEEITRVRNGKTLKYVKMRPETPLQIPEGVEEDTDTGDLRYVKRHYTLNKVRLRLAMPTVPSDYIDTVKTPEGASLRKI